jgi:hypothetical protein
MFTSSKDNLACIIDLLHELPDDVYIQPSPMLSQSTIGQHVRHIVELYQGLLAGYGSGQISYDDRKRDRTIETDKAAAEKTIAYIAAQLPKPNIPLQISGELNGQSYCIQSNYEREVLYNLEHAIHHMALIKVAVIEMTAIELPKEFGVAPATLQYRAQCAL